MTVGNTSLRVSPRCRATDQASAPGVTPGPARQRGDSVVALCTKDTRLGAAGSSGGTYDVDADLALDAPPPRSARGYTAIVTLQLS